MNTITDQLRKRPSDPGDPRVPVGAAVGALTVFVVAAALIPLRDHIPEREHGARAGGAGTACGRRSGAGSPVPRLRWCRR